MSIPSVNSTGKTLKYPNGLNGSSTKSDTDSGISGDTYVGDIRIKQVSQRHIKKKMKIKLISTIPGGHSCRLRVSPTPRVIILRDDLENTLYCCTVVYY